MKSRKMTSIKIVGVICNILGSLFVNNYTINKDIENAHWF